MCQQFFNICSVFQNHTKYFKDLSVFSLNFPKHSRNFPKIFIKFIPIFQNFLKLYPLFAQKFRYILSKLRTSNAAFWEGEAGICQNIVSEVSEQTYQKSRNPLAPLAKLWYVIALQIQFLSSLRQKIFSWNFLQDNVLTEIGVPTYPKSALHLNQPIDRSKKEHKRRRIAFLIRNRKGWPSCRKGTRVHEGNPQACGLAVQA